MNIKTTAIMLITASTLFTGCVSETLTAITPSAQEETIIADSNVNENKDYAKKKTTELSKKADIAIDKGIDSWFDKLMAKLGLS